MATSNNQLQFYDNLLQITFSDHALLYEVKFDEQTEIKQIENLSHFMDEERFVNTGFELSIKSDIQDDKGNVHLHKRFHTNQNCNLLFVSEKMKKLSGKRTARQFNG